MKRSETPTVRSAIILVEQQDLINQVIRVTIAHFSEATITGSPTELLRNAALVASMNKKALFRLSFLSGIEQEEALARKHRLAKAQRTSRSRQ